MDGNGIHDLGALELESRLASANVNLRLSSEINFVKARKDENDNNEFRPLECLLNGDAYNRPWIVKSHSFHFVISLNVGPALKLEDEAFAEKVASQLKHSEARNGVLS